MLVMHRMELLEVHLVLLLGVVLVVVVLLVVVLVLVVLQLQLLHQLLLLQVFLVLCILLTLLCLYSKGEGVVCSSLHLLRHLLGVHGRELLLLLLLLLLRVPVVSSLVGWLLCLLVRRLWPLSLF
jgi:hypothetical protein